MPKKPLRAEATVREKRDGERVRVDAVVPAEVRQALEVSAGDRLVFERGSAFAAERASTRPGGYFVVWCEPARREAAPPLEEASPPAPEASAPRLCPLAEDVRRRLEGR
jgi:bifunctional DNA-binding transcriptional regulator/antitoxin component of YhaV-PrlF toxin-antitoxin module